MTASKDQSNCPHAGAIAAGLAEVRRRVAEAAARAGRDPAEVQIIAVSKTKPAADIRAAFEAGQRLFGESRIQEALPKIDELGDGPQWHLIGHLQTNKVRAAAGRFALIHSVDSPRLLEAIEQRTAELGRTQEVLLQVNVSGEAAKYGVEPDQLEPVFQTLAQCAHVRALGLMTIPPLTEHPDQARPHFVALRELSSRIGERPNFTPRHLSMGMSGDYAIAVEEGATLVRVGTAIFGTRP